MSNYMLPEIIKFFKIFLNLKNYHQSLVNIRMSIYMKYPICISIGLYNFIKM